MYVLHIIFHPVQLWEAMLTNILAWWIYHHPFPKANLCRLSLTCFPQCLHKVLKRVHHWYSSLCIACLSWPLSLFGLRSQKRAKMYKPKNWMPHSKLFMGIDPTWPMTFRFHLQKVAFHFVCSTFICQLSFSHDPSWWWKVQYFSCHSFEGFLFFLHHSHIGIVYKVKGVATCIEIHLCFETTKLLLLHMWVTHCL
jgi:hypothetical protein